MAKRKFSVDAFLGSEVLEKVRSYWKQANQHDMNSIAYWHNMGLVGGLLEGVSAEYNVRLNYISEDMAVGEPGCLIITAMQPHETEYTEIFREALANPQQEITRNGRKRHDRKC